MGEHSFPCFLAYLPHVVALPVLAKVRQGDRAMEAMWSNCTN